MVGLVGLSAIAIVASSDALPVQLWKLDPLEAVFPDTPFRNAQVDPVHVARGEFAEWQLAVRCDNPISSLKVRTSPMVLEGDAAKLGKPRARFIGLVNLSKPPTWVSSTQLHPIPGDFPDPLLNDKETSVKAGEAKAIWIDIEIPRSADPGNYKGSVEVIAKVGDTQRKLQMPIEMAVHKTFVRKCRLKATNWYFAWPQYWTVKTTKGEDQAEAQLKIIAKSMARHRLNVAMASPMALATYGLDKDGNRTVTFEKFDARVKMLMKAGVIGMIEGDGMGTRTGWAKPNLGVVYEMEIGKAVQKVFPADDARVEKFYAWYFPELLKHLKKRGWTKIYAQHIIDEPCDDNVDSYRVLSNLAVKYLPGIRRMDTCCGQKFEGLMDIYSPELDFLNENYELFKKFQKDGKELWYYTCWKPQGEYANRLIEEPLIKTRLLHWIHFRYGITGFLHWGLDYWAFNEANGSKRDQYNHDYSPGGDGWIVYPGKNGDLVESRRYEAQRDSMADHELLSMLADKNPKKAQELAGQIVFALNKYELDIAKFRAIRKELLEALD